MHTEAKNSDVSDSLTCSVEIRQRDWRVFSDLGQCDPNPNLPSHLNVLVVSHMVVGSVLMDIRSSRPFRNVQLPHRTALSQSV